MTAFEAITRCAREEQWQLLVNQFIDDFRRASPSEKEAMIQESPNDDGPFAGLMAGVVSELCREASMRSPEWLKTTHSREPFFALTTNDYALRVRLMLESPPAFRARNVFVPENYLQRA